MSLKGEKSLSLPEIKTKPWIYKLCLKSCVRHWNFIQGTDSFLLYSTTGKGGQHILLEVTDLWKCVSEQSGSKKARETKLSSLPQTILRKKWNWQWWSLGDCIPVHILFSSRSFCSFFNLDLSVPPWNLDLRDIRSEKDFQNIECKGTEPIIANKRVLIEYGSCQEHRIGPRVISLF